MRPPKPLIIILVLISCLSGLHAQQFMYEGFAAEGGKVGDRLEGLATASHGFSGPWSGPGEGIGARLVEGLTLGALPTSGLAVEIQRAALDFNKYRFLARPLPLATSSGTLWLSYLTRWDEDNGGKGHSMAIGLGPYSHLDDDGMSLHTRVLSINDNDRFAVGFGSAQARLFQRSNRPGSTVLVVVRWHLKPDGGEAKMWLLDSAAAVDAVLASPQEDSLDRVAAEAQVLRVDAPISLSRDQHLKLGGYTGGAAGAYRIVVDELRLGGSLAAALSAPDQQALEQARQAAAESAPAAVVDDQPKIEEPIAAPASLANGEALTWGQEPVVERSSLRGEIVLNGAWQFMPAADGSAAWSRDQWGWIRVPGTWTPGWTEPGILIDCPENPFWSRYFGKGHDETGKPRLSHRDAARELESMWYRRRIDVPAAWAGRAILVELQWLSTDAQVYVDGQLAGEIAWPAGEVDISALVTPGRSHTLRMRVAAQADQGFTWTSMGTEAGMQTRKKAHLDSRGLTGDVLLTSRPRGAFVSDVFVKPSTRNDRITLDIEVSDLRQAGPVAVEARMIGPDGAVERTFTAKQALAVADVQRFELSWPWADAKRWDYGQPNLYTVQLAVTGAGIEDVFAQRFGFREFWIEGRELYLNGKPFRLRPFLSGLVMGTEDRYRIAFQDMIAAGFNITEIWPNEIRRGISYADDMLYRVADEAGFPVMARAGSMVGILNERKWDDPAARKRWIDVTSHIIRKNRNHPSILIWAHSGNTFGYPNDISPQLMGRRDVLHDPGTLERYRMGEEACDAIRAVDPTRAVMTHHGGYVGDIHTANHYLNIVPLQEREEWMSEHVASADMPYCGIEFGVPDNLTFYRNRTDHGSSGVSEPWHTEFAAIYLGPEAYRLESDWFRADIIAGFKGSEEHKDLGTLFRWHGWQYRKRHAIQPQVQAVMSLFIRNTWRSFRAAGHTGGVLPWSGAHGWTNQDHANPSDPNPWGGARFEDRVVFNQWRPGSRGPWFPYSPTVSHHPFSAEHQTQLPAGDALVANGQASLAFIGGAPSVYEKSHLFSPGQKLGKQLVVINDAREDQPYTATISVTLDGKELLSRRFTGVAEVGRNVFERIEVALPRRIEGSTARGEIALSARIGEREHSDRFAFRVHAAAPVAPRTITVFDPLGHSSRMLEALGHRVVAWGGSAVPLLVVGREALSSLQRPPADLRAYVQAGGRLLIDQQEPEWLRGCGWRVSRHVTRRAWPIGTHPITSGLDGEDLRDWSGAGTLVPPTSPVGSGETPQPPFAWRWGNRGSVSCAAVEKPHHSGWTPILECEFDLQYSPLMELDLGQGKVVWSQLDLVDAIAAADPVARLLAQRIVDHVASAKVAPRAASAYLGGRDGLAVLERIGVEVEPVAALDRRFALTVIGADAAVDEAQLQAYLQAGKRVLFLARAPGPSALGVRIERVGELPQQKPWVHGHGSALDLGSPADWSSLFHGGSSVPAWPEARGLSLSDLRFRTFHPAAVVTAGAEIGADGLLARKQLGAGVAIFCQIDPDRFDTQAKPYLRFTRWRQTRALAQVLANLGASFAVDPLTIQPQAIRLPLAGAGWKATLVSTRPAVMDWKDRLPSRPISDQAAALVGVSVDDSAWQQVAVPDVWGSYGAAWRGIEGEAVYRRQVDLPADWAGKDLVLEFGRFQANKQTLRDQDDTFFNGQRVGGAGDYWASRSYPVPGALVRAGANMLAVRLASKIGGGGILTMPQDFCIRLEDAASLALYHPDYRDDWAEGDEPYRWVRW